ncbi:hypothetical protein FACS1894142_6140 [Spirochaetia bacterium]|nr:hypothetical protein FACS1894142_6140 [Spirochaetia bacterium]
MNQTAKKGAKPTKKNIVPPAESAADMLEEFGITDAALLAQMKELAMNPDNPNGAMLRHLQKIKSKPADRAADAKLKLMEERAETLRLKNAEKRGELISRSVVETYINDFYGAMTAILLPTGAKIIDRLAAIAGVNDVSVKLKMLETLEDEHYSFLETVEKTADGFLNRYGEGKVDPPPRRSPLQAARKVKPAAKGKARQKA